MLMKRSSFGWMEILLGILMVIMGIYSLANPVESLGVIVVAYAIVVIVNGIANFVMYCRLERHGGFGSAMMIVSGVLNLLIGVLLLFNVGAGAIALGILFPIWFLIHCISRLSNMDFVKSVGSKFEYWVALIANILGLIFALMILFNPFAGAIALIYFVALYLLIEGFSSIIGGFGSIGKEKED